MLLISLLGAHEGQAASQSLLSFLCLQCMVGLLSSSESIAGRQAAACIPGVGMMAKQL